MLTASEARYELEDGEMSINGEVYTVAETEESDVYDLYAEYCKRNGYKLFTKANFITEFCEEYGFEVKNTTRGGEGQCRRFVRKKS